MSEKFQAEMKELDEKFAAIPENLKKRYDKHRLIRRSSMVFLTLLFGLYQIRLHITSVQNEAYLSISSFRPTQC